MSQENPDPSNPGPPIEVRLDDLLLGDLGNARVDARLLRTVLERDGAVAKWLRRRGVDAEDIEETFPGSGWEG